MINALSDANILLVDDDEELLRLSERRLARAGFGDLTSTTDALDALNLFEGEKFDLVILDLRMPGMDGIHLAARMRKLRSPKESAIIVLSAVDNDKLIGQLLKQGVIDDFIRKPPGSMEFIARVERILQRFLASGDGENTAASEPEDVTSPPPPAPAAPPAENCPIDSMTAAIGCAIEYREHGSEGKRSQLAGLISSSIARQLGWKPADCDGMRIATTLVGIGRLAIPEGLMLRRSTLTLRELSGMRDQFSRGALWLIKSAGSDPAPVLKQAIAAISDYHEQWDGNGFPNGKYGEAIAIEARIILLASTITDWIAEDRRGIEASLDELSSIRFDPTLTAIASELLSEWRRTWSGIAAEQSTRQ